MTASVIVRAFFLGVNHVVKDRLCLLHFFGGKGAESDINGVIRVIGNELVVRTAALLGGFSGGIGEAAAEDAGADEREGDAVEAIVSEDAQGVVQYRNCMICN